MKLFGNVNIMGIKEVIFTTNVECVNTSDKVVNVPMTLRIFCFDGAMWLPDTGNKRMTEKQMTKSLKSLAQNPKVKLTFNDGAMYVLIPNPNKL
jgi:hypothetical protein